MELADEITIPAPRDRVYEALNDVAILKACIPGCEELEKESENELVAKVTLEVGPVEAKFGGRVTQIPARHPACSACPVKVTEALPVSPRAGPMWN